MVGGSWLGDHGWDEFNTHLPSLTDLRMGVGGRNLFLRENIIKLRRSSLGQRSTVWNRSGEKSKWEALWLRFRYSPPILGAALQIGEAG